LAEDPRAVAFELIAVEDAAVLDVALPHLAEGDLEREEFEATWALLDNESFSIRESVTRYLLGRHDRRRLVAFLNAYPKGRYFYSVIARIDRELYAPGWVRRSARSILGG
jgi:hypothetical protein